MLFTLLQDSSTPNLDFQPPVIPQDVSFGMMMFRTIVVLLIIAAMIYAFLYLLKKFTKGRFMLKGSPADALEIVERIPLSTKQEICLLRIKNSILVLGVTEQSISVLKEMAKTELFRKEGDS